MPKSDMNRQNLLLFLPFYLQTLFFTVTLFSFSMYSMSTSVIVALLTISVFIVIHYTKLPTVDTQLSRPVLLAHKQNKGKRSAIIAHQGGALDAPGNTLAAFREAKKNGADGVEFDLVISKDNIGVLRHDVVVDSSTDGSGLVADMTFDELRNLDASVKSPYHQKFKGERIPSFEEAIKECINLDLTMYIDIKSSDSRTVLLIVEMFKKYNLYDKAVVKAFNPLVIYQIRSMDPNIIGVLLTRPYYASYHGAEADAKPKHDSIIQLSFYIVVDWLLEWSIKTWVWYITGASAVSLHHHTISRYEVERWRAAGLEVLTWTVNDPEEKIYFSYLNIPYITDTLK